MRGQARTENKVQGYVERRGGTNARGNGTRAPARNNVDRQGKDAVRLVAVVVPCRWVRSRRTGPKHHAGPGGPERQSVLVP